MLIVLRYTIAMLIDDLKTVFRQIAQKTVHDFPALMRLL